VVTLLPEVEIFGRLKEPQIYWDVPTQLRPMESGIVDQAICVMESLIKRILIINKNGVDRKKLPSRS